MLSLHVVLGFVMPYNFQSGKRYRAINALSLLMAGSEDPRWMTYRQAEERGLQVRKGEKSMLKIVCKDKGWADKAWCFRKVGYRRIRLNKGVEWIDLMNSELCKIKKRDKQRKNWLVSFVLPTRFELISMVPETIILSIELREQGCKYRKIKYISPKYKSKF